MSDDWLKQLTRFSSQPTLLFVGLLPPRLARATTLPHKDRLGTLFVEYWRKLHGRAWPWRLREHTAQLVRTPADESTLIEAGELLLNWTRADWNQPGRGLRVEVNIPEHFDAVELQTTLLQAGADSVFLRNKDEVEMVWSWPLRIAIKSDSQLLDGIHPQSSLRPSFQSFAYERPPMRANLLFYERSLTDAKALKNSQTDSLIVLGGLGASSESVTELLSKTSKITGAQGIFIFSPVNQQHADLARDLITNLTHDLPIDSAVAALAKQWGINVVSWSTRSLAHASSVREQGRVLARTLQRMGETRVSLPADAFEAPVKATKDVIGTARPRLVERLKLGRLAYGGPTRTGGVKKVAAGELGANVAERLRVPKEGEEIKAAPMFFDQESSGAQKLAALANVTAKDQDQDAARQENRHLQVRVETVGGRALGASSRLRPDRTYLASVFIGAIAEDYLFLENPLEAPEPPDENPLSLYVFFWEPDASPDPQVKKLSLPARGNTEKLSFPFHTASDQTFFSARIAVYHRNRNLQTGLLQGRVGAEPANLGFTLDATPLTKFVGLAERAAIDASIILNDDVSGNVQAYVYRNGEAAVAPVSDETPPPHVDVEVSRYDSLAKLTDVLGRAITRITAKPEDYSDLEKEGSRTLLLELAQHGSALLTRLRKHTLMANLFDNVRNIQIVSAHFDAFFPIEYLYDGTPPEDHARLCSGAPAAIAALTSGKCCGAYDVDCSGTICPLRFWSLSKVIERHAHRPEHTDLKKEFQLRSDLVSARNRLLDPLAGAVLAASQDANAADKDAVKNLCTSLDAVLRTQTVPATDWKSWAENIEKTRPKLLVLLPHHEQSGGSDFLEVGGDKLKSVLITEKHVRAAKDTEARPIVLLIGCDTSSAKVDLEGFVPTFQDAGAVIIVSTIATILGRHAGPAAAAIVEELKRQEANPNATFGEVMLAVRRRLLAGGIPMVLGLTSYGDADWRIGFGAS